MFTIARVNCWKWSQVLHFTCEVTVHGQWCPQKYIIYAGKEVRNYIHYEIKGKLSSEDACSAFFTKLKRAAL